MTKVYKSSYNITTSVRIKLAVVLKNNLAYIPKLQIKRTFRDAFVSLLLGNWHHILDDVDLRGT